MRSVNTPFLFFSDVFGNDLLAPVKREKCSSPLLSHNISGILLTTPVEVTTVGNIPLEIWAYILEQIHHIPTLVNLEITSHQFARIYQAIYTKEEREDHKQPYTQEALALLAHFKINAQYYQVTIPLPGTTKHQDLKDRWVDKSLHPHARQRTLITQSYIKIWEALLQPEIRKHHSYTAHLIEILLDLSEYVENTSAYTLGLFKYGLSWQLFDELADIDFDKCTLLMIKYFYRSLIYIYHACVPFPEPPKTANFPCYRSDLLNHQSLSLRTPIHDFLSARLPLWGFSDIHHFIERIHLERPDSIFSLLANTDYADTNVHYFLEQLLTSSQEEDESFFMQNNVVDTLNKKMSHAVLSYVHHQIKKKIVSRLLFSNNKRKQAYL